MKRIIAFFTLLAVCTLAAAQIKSTSGYTAKDVQIQYT